MSMAGKMTPSKMNSGIVQGQPQQQTQPQQPQQQSPFRALQNRGIGGFGSVASMMSKYQPPSIQFPSNQPAITDVIETPQIDNPMFKRMPVRAEMTEPSLASIEPQAQKDIKWSGNYNLTPMDNFKAALAKKGLFGGTMGGAGRALGKFNKK